MHADNEIDIDLEDRQAVGEWSDKQADHRKHQRHHNPSSHRRPTHQRKQSISTNESDAFLRSTLASQFASSSSHPSHDVYISIPREQPLQTLSRHGQLTEPSFDFLFLGDIVLIQNEDLNDPAFLSMGSLSSTKNQRVVHISSHASHPSRSLFEIVSAFSESDSGASPTSPPLKPTPSPAISVNSSQIKTPTFSRFRYGP